MGKADENTTQKKMMFKEVANYSSILNMHRVFSQFFNFLFLKHAINAIFIQSHKGKITTLIRLGTKIDIKK